MLDDEMMRPSSHPFDWDLIALLDPGEFKVVLLKHKSNFEFEKSDHNGCCLR